MNKRNVLKTILLLALTLIAISAKIDFIWGRQVCSNQDYQNNIHVSKITNKLVL